LESQNDVESLGLLSALTDFTFVFGLDFLMHLFMSASAASEALQANDVDLAAAANAVETLIEFVTVMRTDDKFNCVYADASKMCENLGISCSVKGGKWKKSKPIALQDFVMYRFVTKSSDALASSSAEEGLKNELRVDFFLPVLDTVVFGVKSPQIRIALPMAATTFL
jgi:hypothetical protein